MAFPRFLPPSGAGSIAATTTTSGPARASRFLPPSGAGSIAAQTGHGTTVAVTGWVPPALRGGGHCGTSGDAAL